MNQLPNGRNKSKCDICIISDGSNADSSTGLFSETPMSEKAVIMATVFVIIALTVICLFAFLGPRPCRRVSQIISYIGSTMIIKAYKQKIFVMQELILFSGRYHETT